MSCIVCSFSKYVFNRLQSTFVIICSLGIWILSYYAGRFSCTKSSCISNIGTNNLQSPILPRDTIPNVTLPTLCVVARTYWAQLSYLPVFALSLYYSGQRNIQIYVVNTDNRTDIQQLQQVVQLVNNFVSEKDFVIYLALGEPPGRRDYGYGMTDRALAYLYEQHTESSSTCDYVTFTNADNLYSRSFMTKILRHMKDGKDLIAWGFVSRYTWNDLKWKNLKRKTVPKVVDDGSQICLPAVLKRGHIDLSAVAYRLSFLKREKLYFMSIGRTSAKGIDGYFAEEASKRTNASVLLRQTLNFHQWILWEIKNTVLFSCITKVCLFEQIRFNELFASIGNCIVSIWFFFGIDHAPRLKVTFLQRYSNNC